MRRFLIDTDPGTDDAVALIMALTHPHITIEAITVVAGNVGLDKTVQNALYLVERCGKSDSVPVYAGADKPLAAINQHAAAYVHGHDGMGDIGLPLTGRTPAPGHAADAIIQAVRNYPSEITLVTLGPLTNLAIALQQDPGIVAHIPRVVVMGGAPDGVGNTTSTAEYNIYADPEAADIVFRSGLPIELVGWDVSTKYGLLTFDDCESIRAIGTPLAQLAIDIQKPVIAYWLRDYGYPAACMPDPIAMAVALSPTLAKSEPMQVEVELEGALTRGMTVVERRLHKATPNMRVVTHVDRAWFIQLLRAAVR